MKISETTFPFLEGDCVQRFGMEKGNAIFRQTEAVYEELLEEFGEAPAEKDGEDE